MTKQISHGNHLLRVVLEHSFCIPSLPPTGLEGSNCIDVGYNLGVVYYRLKNIKSSLFSISSVLNPTKTDLQFQLNTNLEFIYLNDPNSRVSHKFGVGKMHISKQKHKDRSKTEDKKMMLSNYRNLLHSISLTIGTINYPESNNFNHIKQIYSSN